MGIDEGPYGALDKKTSKEGLFTQAYRSLDLFFFFFFFFFFFISEAFLLIKTERVRSTS